MKFPVDLDHHFPAIGVEVADPLQFNGIVIGVGIAKDEMNVQTGEEGFYEVHDLMEFMETPSHLPGSKADFHRPYLFREVSKLGTWRKKLGAVGLVDMKTFGIGIVDDDPFEADLAIIRIRKLDKYDGVIFKDRSLELDFDDSLVRGEFKFKGFVSLPI